MELLLPPGPRRFEGVCSHYHAHFAEEETEDQRGAQHHTASQWQGWDLNPGPWAPLCPKPPGQAVTARWASLGAVFFSLVPTIPTQGGGSLVAANVGFRARPGLKSWLGDLAM